MTTKTHTPTIDELRAQADRATDPNEYDSLMRQIREAERDAHLSANRARIEAEKAAEAARAQAEAVHDANVKKLKLAPSVMTNLDRKIFKSLTETYALLAERYEYTHSTLALAAHVRGEAEALGLPHPPAITDPNGWPDRRDVATYASEWIRRFSENQAAAKIAGVPFTLDHMKLPSYRIQRPVPDTPDPRSIESGEGTE